MSSELDNTDQLKHFYDDCRANGIEFLPPDINESDYRFTPYPNMKIRYALGAIKGTGEAAVESIIAARQSGGKFTGLLDFCEREFLLDRILGNFYFHRLVPTSLFTTEGIPFGFHALAVSDMKSKKFCRCFRMGYQCSWDVRMRENHR